MLRPANGVYHLRDGIVVAAMKESTENNIFAVTALGLLAALAIYFSEPSPDHRIPSAATLEIILKDCDARHARPCMLTAVPMQTFDGGE